MSGLRRSFNRRARSIGGALAYAWQGSPMESRSPRASPPIDEMLRSPRGKKNKKRPSGPLNRGGDAALLNLHGAGSIEALTDGKEHPRPSSRKMFSAQLGRRIAKGERRRRKHEARRPIPAVFLSPGPAPSYRNTVTRFRQVLRLDGDSSLFPAAGAPRPRPPNLPPPNRPQSKQFAAPAKRQSAPVLLRGRLPTSRQTSHVSLRRRATQTPASYAFPDRNPFPAGHGEVKFPDGEGEIGRRDGRSLAHVVRYQVANGARVVRAVFPPVTQLHGPIMGQPSATRGHESRSDVNRRWHFRTAAPAQLTTSDNRRPFAALAADQAWPRDSVGGHRARSGRRAGRSCSSCGESASGVQPSLSCFPA